jgi:hypothetical protein
MLVGFACNGSSARLGTSQGHTMTATKTSGTIGTISYEVREWSVGRSTGTAWTILSFALFVAGLLVYGAVHGSGSVSLDVGQILLGFLVTLALMIGVLIAHEGVHGIVMRRFGAEPEYGLIRYGPLPIALYCTAPGHRFTRMQYVAVAMAPLVTIALPGLAAVAWLPNGGWLVVPLAFHLSGCVGDLGMTGVVLREPAGTLIEDQRAGMRIFRPAVQPKM